MWLTIYYSHDAGYGIMNNPAVLIPPTHIDRSLFSPITTVFP